MAIKDEIQGPNGYLKKVREETMPNTKEMADLALEKYQGEIGKILVKDDVMGCADEILRELFIAETEIFSEKNSEIMQNVLPYYYDNIYEKKDEKYAETSIQIKRLLEIYNMCKNETITTDVFIKEISDITVPIIDTVSFSQKQSAKCRVGETLQNHLSKIFDICEIPYETQQQRVEGGTIMDFIIPSSDDINKAPDQVINIECQTTLKDRFRLTTGKSTDGKVKRYLATITGAGIVTARDTKDLTAGKVKEIIQDNNVTLVVLESVKANIKSMLEETKLKYEDKKTTVGKDGLTVDDINRLIELSDKKIVSFNELITKDIKSIMVYWQ
ncbi:MAG: type II restriction endonuclease [Velocimicrobium sp.]